ncbi:MAG: hypothetical protein PHG65_06745 [Kiritimatiellae bacterium]|nr:hypothetical protein [Kiritimatiellia bacterium]
MYLKTFVKILILHLVTCHNLIAAPSSDKLDRGVVSNFNAKIGVSQKEAYLMSVIDQRAQRGEKTIKQLRVTENYQKLTHEKATALHLLNEMPLTNKTVLLVSQLDLYDEINQTFPARDIIMEDEPDADIVPILVQYIKSKNSLEGSTGLGILKAAQIMNHILGSEAYKEKIQTLKPDISPDVYHMISTLQQW